MTVYRQSDNFKRLY